MKSTRRAFVVASVGALSAVHTLRGVYAAPVRQGDQVNHSETIFSWRLEYPASGDTVLITPDGRRLTLQATDYRAAVWATALTYASQIGAPLYLEFDDQSQVRALIVAQRRVVMGMRPEPGAPAEAITFRQAPSIYHLMHDVPDYARIHGLLSRTADTHEEVWVASLPGRAMIVDVRPLQKSPAP